jgi:hypothetical protein
MMGGPLGSVAWVCGTLVLLIYIAPFLDPRPGRR